MTVSLRRDGLLVQMDRGGKHYDRTRPAHYPNGRVTTDDAFSTRMIFMTRGRATAQGVGLHEDLMAMFPSLGMPHP